MADNRERLERLVARLRGGAEADAWNALHELVGILAPAAEARLRSFHLQTAEIEDAVADAALALFEHRRRLDPSRSVAGYFLATVRNRALRQLATRAASLPGGDSIPASRGSPSHVGGPGPTRMSRRLHEALSELDSVDVAILDAYAAAADDRRWTQEIGERLGMDANAVRVRKSRALSKLREILDALERTTPPELKP